MSQDNKVPYTVRSVSYSNTNDKSPYLSLELRLHGHTFRLYVPGDRFQNSPRRLAEFNDFHAQFRQPYSTREWGPMFDWAVAPLAPRLDELAPAVTLKENPTLQDYIAGANYRCELGAVDDVLVVETVNVIDRGDAFWRWGGDRNLGVVSADLFRIVSPSAAELVPVAPDALDQPCRLVSVDGQQFSFDICTDTASGMASTMDTYKKIARAGFPPSIHVRCLEGVVVDDRNNVPLGSLFPAGHRELVYEQFERKKVSLATKRRWVSQLREAVGALHAVGIVWGAVSTFNVFIDTEDNLWVGGFNTSWFDDWVSEDKVDTIEGDLQAVEELVSWILQLGEDGGSSKL